jgi:cytochrome c556
MKLSHIKRNRLIAGAVIMMTCSQASSEIKPEPLALQKIMKDMGKNMQVITDGISREDWKLIEKTAPLIADHPQPPMVEKVKILAFVGADVSKFKGYDGKTHEAARVLGESAAREDGYAIISDFATLQNTCLMCHQSFRKKFQEHFYGEL